MGLGFFIFLGLLEGRDGSIYILLVFLDNRLLGLYTHLIHVSSSKALSERSFSLSASFLATSVAILILSRSIDKSFNLLVASATSLSLASTLPWRSMISKELPDIIREKSWCWS